VGGELLTTCLDAGSRDNMSVLIVALSASGLTFAALLTTSLSESAALRKEGANIIAVVDAVTRVLAYG
jgi:hypothetical protein